MDGGRDWVLDTCQETIQMGISVGSWTDGLECRREPELRVWASPHCWPQSRTRHICSGREHAMGKRRTRTGA